MSLVSMIVLAILAFQVERSEFTISADGEKIGSEEFAIARNGDGFLATGRTRLEFNGQRFDARSRMELDATFRPISYEYSSGDQVLRVEIEEGSAEIVYTSDGGRTPQEIRFPAEGVIVDDNFFHHYLLLLYYLGGSGGSVPVFVPQQMTLGPLQVELVGDRTYRLQSENLRLRVTTDEDGRLLRLISEDSNIIVER
jgi:hypothetical protein